MLTPKRHVEPLLELTDEELHALWLDTVLTLESEIAAAIAFGSMPSRAVIALPATSASAAASTAISTAATTSTSTNGSNESAAVNSSANGHATNGNGSISNGSFSDTKSADSSAEDKQQSVPEIDFEEMVVNQGGSLLAHRTLAEQESSRRLLSKSRALAPEAALLYARLRGFPEGPRCATVVACSQ